MQFNLQGRRTTSGFTLIEVLMVVAIIGILTAIAVPAYNDYTNRGKFAEAAAHLSGQRVRMEQFYQDNRNYGVGTTCGITIPATKYFSYACVLDGGDQAYTITATGLAALSAFSFTIDQSNARTTSAVPADWKQPTPNNCWVRKKNGSC